MHSVCESVAYHNSSRDVEGCHLDVVRSAVTVHGTASDTAPRALQLNKPILRTCRIALHMLSSHPDQHPLAGEHVQIQVAFSSGRPEACGILSCKNSIKHGYVTWYAAKMQ